MTATTVNGKLLSPAAGQPASSQVTIALVDYNDTPVVGFNTVDDTEILATDTIIPTPAGLWTAQLAPNADIQLTDGALQTAYRIVESGAGSTFTYWIIVAASVNPVWAGSIRTTLVGNSGGSTPNGYAIQGALTVGGDTTLNGGLTIPAGAAAGKVWTATDTGGDGAWQTPSGGGGGGGTPASTVQPGTAYGVASAVGTDTSYAREDHQHGTVSLTTSAPSTTEGIGQSAAVGTASTPARADHVHPMAAAGTPGSSAVGDAAAAGVATTFAASDHKHARESFGAVTALAAFGTASTNGTSTSLARADHVHGAPSLAAASTTTAGIVQLDGTAGDIAALGTQAAGSTGKAADAGHVHPAPATATAGASAVGDTAAAGSASTYSASDHRHSREAFGAVTAQTSYAAASANGSATTVSHSDHTHGTPALPTTAQIGAANRLTPTAVKTAAYTAQAGDLVPVDATAGNVPITLVSAPADGTVIAVKMIATASSHTTTVTCGGTDVYNKSGGATVATLSLTAQAILLQYSASSGIWYVVGDDLPLTQLDARYVAKTSPVNLTDGATIATDASLSTLYRVTLGGNRTLSNPTNGTDGQLITWSIKQDATGSRTLTLDTKFRFGTDITSITLTTTPGKTDHIGARYNSGDDKWDVIAFVRGF